MDTCSLIFTGDIGFDRYMYGRWNDENLLDDSILSFCRSADHVVANVEAAILPSTGGGAYCHTMDSEATVVLQRLHADIWNIANNHIMDAGVEGLSNTQHIAESMNATTIGAGQNIESASCPVILPAAGGIGLISIGYQPDCPAAAEGVPGVFSWDSWEQIRQRIAEVKSTCRWCIIVCHGGEEFAPLPSSYTRERYLRYLALGADIVVGHHPHVPENYELLPDGKAIFYSLGNFIFDTDYQRAHRYTETGVLLKLCFSAEGFTFEALGTQLDRKRECITGAPLPPIFTEIPPAHYEALVPWGARALVAEEKRRMIYLEPERFASADAAAWDAYFQSTEPEGYIAGAHMDFYHITALSAQATALPPDIPTSVLSYLESLL